MKRWKSCLIVLVFIALTVFGMQTVFADESGKCGENLTWTLDDAGTLTISGTGEMFQWIAYGSAPWYEKSIKKVVINEGVTNIGANAFGGCHSLTSITIPNSVTSFGRSAFCECYNLIMSIPSSVTSIGEGAFQLCKSFTNITIPSSITCIEPNTFQACTSLTSITIPSSVTSIGHNAFESCSSLTSITIPSSVTSIGAGTFDQCIKLTSITIPSSITSIGSGAFYTDIQRSMSKMLEKYKYKRYKFLATGHSLGGAVANLFSAAMTNTSGNEKRYILLYIWCC